MTDAFSPLTRKLAAVGLAVLFLTALATLIVLPLTDRYSARDAEIAKARRQLETYRQILSRQKKVRSDLKQLTENPRYRTGFLPGETPALAGARLENSLKAIVQAGGGVMRSTRMQPQSEDDPQRVRLTLDFTASPKALMFITHKIETAAPYLMADNVQIRLIPARGDNPESMSAHMDVSAFLWRAEP